LLEYIRAHYSSETSCISSIRIDDQEMSEREEAAFSLLPLADLKKVEITTQHPRELAEETLQDLLTFTEHLARFSREAGQQFRDGDHPSAQLAKLFDGMKTFSEAMESSKQVLKTGRVDAIHVVEVDLFSIMQDVLDAYHDGNHEYLVDLLEKHLPENLDQWREKTLPLLIRSKDS
jgi:hypothetical protein